MRVLITGAAGFIGKNLAVRLRELDGFDVTSFTRDDPADALQTLVSAADAIVHLAGENRPKDPAGFEAGNAGLTRHLCELMRGEDKGKRLLLASSTQAELDNPYGGSKRAAEEAVERLGAETSHTATIFRLPNVFGKWSMPNYNSAIATFCHNIARGLPIRIDDPAAPLRLAYVDDVVDAFLSVLSESCGGVARSSVEPEYATTVGEVAGLIQEFAESRDSLVTARVGSGLTRALYSTYVSFLPETAFAYPVPAHGDRRGVFVEMLKTPDCGQFSYFTAHPGVTRGGHYHHTKTEKFLVMQGTARFGFRHILTDERIDLTVTGDRATIVETIPGWAHDITNVGENQLIVMLWANEVFDRHHPDTNSAAV